MAGELPDFDAIADLYEQQAEPLTGLFVRQALALAELEPGARVIDVASGPGVLSVAAAEAGARVLASDLAPAMVARAGRRLAAYPGCEARVMSCDALDAGDASFDAAFSIFGVSIVPVWREGLKEMARVVRPGGKVVLASWPDGLGAKPILVLRRAFDLLYPGRDFWPGGTDTWNEATLRDALVADGFSRVDFHEVASTYSRPSVEVLLETSTPFFRFVPGVKALDENEWSRLREALVEAFTVYAGSDGAVHLPVEACVAVGQKI